MGALSLDGSLWRRLARWGSSRAPEWFVRVAPPVVGVAVCALSRRRRVAIVRNLRRVRGRRGPFRDGVDAARTFANYAACLAEVLGAWRDGGASCQALVSGESHLHAALAEGHGVLLVTAHAGGWEAGAALLSRNLGLPVMIVDRGERDAGARAIQDEARHRRGLRVVHVGEDPLSALPLIGHLRERGLVALQMDRVPVGMRARRVTMFGENAHVPEGPLRLAALTGAPVVPVFSARRGHRRHDVFVGPPISLTRSSGEAELDAAAQELADALCGFVRSHPTQWFHFNAE